MPVISPYIVFLYPIKTFKYTACAMHLIGKSEYSYIREQSCTKCTPKKDEIPKKGAYTDHKHMQYVIHDSPNGLEKY